MGSDYFNTIGQLLVGLEGIEISNVVHQHRELHIYISIKRYKQRCPYCGELSNRVHDYRKQPVHDIPSFGKVTILQLNKRRYTCEKCGKHFAGDIPFLSKYLTMTSRLSFYIIA